MLINNIPLYLLVSLPFMLFIVIIGIMAFFLMRTISERKELKSALCSEREKYELELRHEREKAAAVESFSEGRIENEKRIARELIDAEKSACRALIEQEREKLAELRKLIAENDDIRKRQSDEFKNAFKTLSEEILEQKSSKFNELQLETLKPLKNDIAKFQEQFLNNIKEDFARRAVLEKHIDDLKSLNIKISEDATNLTNALKGEVKTQGNWGELILERILEDSGLKEGIEYVTQSTIRNEDGRNIRPDVVVKLPQERCIVIDSKVSLTAYERFVNEDSEQAKKALNKGHLDSIRSHIKELADKKYHEYTDGQKLDFTVMFVPIEGALMEALNSDIKLYSDAYGKNVMLASPSTLMVILKLINVLWRNENRDKNIEEIGYEVSRLLKKFDTFIKYMDDIGKELDSAHTVYEKAVRNLRDGKGSISDKMELISKLMNSGSIADAGKLNSSTEDEDLIS